MPDLKTQLGDYLEHVIQRVDVEEIVQERVGAGPVRPIQLRRPTRRVPGWVYGVAAAAIAFLVFGGGAYLWGQRVESAGVPADNAIGLHGLPPDGATPSMPPTGELVASMWSHRGGSGEFLVEGSLYVYADGRVIWDSWLPSDRSVDGFSTTGFVEQRLTPEGVELVRDEMVATGLFDTEPRLPPLGVPLAPPAIGHLQVRDGDRLAFVYRGGLEQEWRPKFDELQQRLRELHSWLPTSAWEDPEPRMYVPSTYGFCTNPDFGPPPAEPSRILALLPTAAQELLGGATQGRFNELSEDPATARGFLPLDAPYCYEVTTEQARTLVNTLDEAGLEVVYPDEDERLAISVDDTDDLSSETAGFVFYPYLPHGITDR